MDVAWKLVIPYEQHFGLIKFVLFYARNLIIYKND